MATELEVNKKSSKRVHIKRIEIEYKDIVVLLRSTNYTAPVFEREFVKNNIPVFSDATSEYLDTMEIQTILSLLKTIDNPLNDINIVSVMRSPIGNFSDNEILEIRLENNEKTVFDNLIDVSLNSKHPCYEKVKKFLYNIEEWKNASKTITLAELIWKIYVDTGFLTYVGLMPNGNLRQANLKMLFERAKEYEKTSFNGLFNFINFTEKLKSGSGDLSSAKIIGENENVVRIMSIHKSKGLEFPVVFLCCTNKQINMQDFKNNILLHKEIGFGPQYIDYERKIKYPTAAKQAIKIKGKDEAIAEEMRILYVALTRAKEKLIITGTVDDFRKNVEKKKNILSMYESKENAINPMILRKYISYLDWIYLVYLDGKMKHLLDFYIHSKDEENIQDETMITNINLEFENILEYKDFKNEFDWKYKDTDLISLPIKTTVSQIKEMKTGKNSEKIGLEDIRASFYGNDNKISSAHIKFGYILDDNFSNIIKNIDI